MKVEKNKHLSIMVLATLLEFSIKSSDIQKKREKDWHSLQKKVFWNLANREFENICCVSVF